MSKLLLPLHNRINMLRLLAAVMLSCGAFSAHAQDSTLERVQLTQMLRQIDMLERTAAVHADQPITARGRYHFDYVRLDADLKRMRSGIQDYLSPRRAQPRDLLEFSGQYRQQSSGFYDANDMNNASNPEQSP